MLLFKNSCKISNLPAMGRPYITFKPKQWEKTNLVKFLTMQYERTNYARILWVRHKDGGYLCISYCLTFCETCSHDSLWAELCHFIEMLVCICRNAGGTGAVGLLRNRWEATLHPEGIGAGLVIHYSYQPSEMNDMFERPVWLLWLTCFSKNKPYEFIHEVWKLLLIGNDFCCSHCRICHWIIATQPSCVLICSALWRIRFAHTADKQNNRSV